MKVCFTVDMSEKEPVRNKVRVTSKSMKAGLRVHFPEIKFSVTRMRSCMVNFIHVRWDWNKLPRAHVARITDAFCDHREWYEDGVSLGQQTIFLEHNGDSPRPRYGNNED